ncbi:hypothetical protein ACTXT7_002648 [Hymenolepis weldensis]
MDRPKSFNMYSYKGKICLFVKEDFCLIALQIAHSIETTGDARIRFAKSITASVRLLAVCGFNDGNTRGWLIENAWSNQSSSPATKPLAVCDFNNRGNCGWKSEETDLGHRWISEQGSICLKSRPSFVQSPNSEDSSWLQGLSDESSDVETDIITRFKSPSIKAAIGLKCIAFDYSFHFGRDSVVIGKSSTLSLLQQQKGKTCGWFNEETDWGHRWIPENGSLCLKTMQFPAEVSNLDESSWLQELSAASSEKEADITTRFKSPPIKAVVGLKCIGFDYSISFRRGENSKSAGKSPSLSLLQQQKGYLSIDRFFQFASSIIKPLAICDFNKGGACGWKIEETDLGHRWTSDYGSFCLKASQFSTPVKKSEEFSWFEGLSAELSNKDINISARFKSPLIPSSVFLKCLDFAYLINRGHGRGSKAVEMPATLSLLQQQKGLFPGAYPVDQNRSLFLSDISPSSVRPLAVCNFDKGGTCGWINDEADWRHQWRVELGSLCLKAKLSTTSIQSLDESSWFQGLTAKSPKKKVDITTRFKSPPIPVSVGLKCISFVYSINLYQAKNSKASETLASLSLLQQQQGAVLDPLKPDFQTCFILLLDFSTSIVKPLAVCDFNNGGTCGWKSEETDLGHRWIPEQGFLCLTGQQSPGSVQNSGESEDWLDGFSIDLPKSVTDVTVRFKSRLIPSSVSLKCLGFSYSINLGSSEIVETSPLSLLQQQKGVTCRWINEEANLKCHWKADFGALCIKVKKSRLPSQNNLQPVTSIMEIITLGKVGVNDGCSSEDLSVLKPSDHLLLLKIKDILDSSSIEFSPLDLQPLAICDFDDGDTCDWKSEETDLGHRWKTNQGSLCLEAKLSSPPVKKSKPSSWFKELSAGSAKKDFAPLDVKPLAICEFNDGEMCGWKSEETDLGHRWTIDYEYLCLKAKQSSSKKSRASSWLYTLSAESQDKDIDVTTRFKSPSIRASVGLKCIGFAYSINLGRSENSESLGNSASLALLQQQKGPISCFLEISSPIIKPLAVCDFSNGGTCGWFNEETEWKHRWKVDQGSLCLKAKQPSSSSQNIEAPWIPGILSETPVETDVTARFKSPSVPPSVGLKCVGFVYSINLGRKGSSKVVEAKSSFSLLQQQKGYTFNSYTSNASSKPLAICDFDNGGTCGWKNEETYLGYRWITEHGLLCLKAKQSSIISKGSEVSFWLPGLSAESTKDETDVMARFRSLSVPSSFGLKCVGFDYSVNLGHGKSSKTSNTSATLLFLQQQKGLSGLPQSHPAQKHLDFLNLHLLISNHWQFVISMKAILEDG